VLSAIPAQTDDRVLVDFRTSDDAGVYKWESGPALVQTVDFFTPIVDDPYDFGRIAATNALSDVYAMGATPICALNLVAFSIDAIGGEVLAEILRGGMLASYGMTREAGEIFATMIARGASPKVRDRAYFYLAKIRYQRGYLAEAEEALAKVEGKLPRELEEERGLLLANLLMTRADYAGAAGALSGLPLASASATRRMISAACAGVARQPSWRSWRRSRPFSSSMAM